MKLTIKARGRGLPAPGISIEVESEGTTIPPEVMQGATDAAEALARALALDFESVFEIDDSPPPEPETGVVVEHHDEREYAYLYALLEEINTNGKVMELLEEHPFRGMSMAERLREAIGVIRIEGKSDDA